MSINISNMAEGGFEMTEFRWPEEDSALDDTEPPLPVLPDDAREIRMQENEK